MLESIYLPMLIIRHLTAGLRKSFEGMGLGARFLVWVGKVVRGVHQRTQTSQYLLPPPF